MKGKNETEVFNRLFNFDDVDNVLEDAWGEFWDTVNAKVFNINREQTFKFNNELNIDPNDDSINKWREEFINRVSKELKNTL